MTDIFQPLIKASVKHLSFRARHRLKRILAIMPILCFVIFSASAETLRVTTWSLRETVNAAGTQASVDSQTNRIEAAAAALKGLDPDVILLQHARDWRMCSQLAQALKPAAYEVVICSSFGAGYARTAGDQQTAILSKRKAYFSWSEAWSNQGRAAGSGGFVFAAVEAAGRRIALYSAALDGRLLQSGRGGSDSPQARALSECEAHWMRQIESIRKWVSNRPECAIVAGELISGPGPARGETSAASPEQAQLAYGFLSAPLAAARPEARERFLAHIATTTNGLPAMILGFSPQTCELDLELVEPVVVSSSAPESSAAKTTPPKERTESAGRTDATKPAAVPAAAPDLPETRPEAEAAAFHPGLLWLAITPAAVLALGIGLWVFARNGSAPRRQTHSDYPLRLEPDRLTVSQDAIVTTSHSGTSSTIEDAHDAGLATVTHQLQVWQQRALAAEQRARRADEVLSAGVVSYLREWLKQKLFRRLIADRAALLETQREATMRALAVDQRLAKIEVQLQQQNQAYEQRIERLTQELAITKEESRALIRAQISQIKAEMDAARARLLAEAESQTAGIGVLQD